MNNKKITYATIALFLTLSTACGGDKKDDKQTQSAPQAVETGAEVKAPDGSVAYRPDTARIFHNGTIDIDKTFITVHMGIGHFRTVDVEDLSKHRMDSERLIISPEAAARINKAKRGGGKVVAIGATVMRGLETYVTTTHEVDVFDGWTNKFIFPPYNYSVPDAIVSNFHLPQSTMLMSVAAFGGYKNVMAAYQSALDNGYSFGPYGDALLIV